MDNLNSINMKKQILLFLAIVLSMPILKAGYTMPGSGTSTDPFLISTAAQLSEVRDSINRDSVTVGKMLYRDKWYKLTDDIDLAGMNWTPIGLGGTNAFNGVFDGNNKIIRNLTIGSAATPMEISICGLFGIVSNSATIQNVILEKVTIYAKSVLKGDCAIGALAGNVTGSSIVNNCSAAGYLDVNYVGVPAATGETPGSMNVGGLVGKLNSVVSPALPTTIINCMTNVSISAKNTGDVVDGTNTYGGVGGLVGHAPNATAPMTRSEVYNSYSLGPIYAESKTQRLAVGGIFGNNCSNVYNVYSASNLTVTSLNGGQIKCNGIVGVRGSALVSAVALNGSIVTSTTNTSSSAYRMINMATNCSDMYASPDFSINGTTIQSTNTNATTTGVYGENLTDITNQPMTILNNYVANWLKIRTIDLKTWVTTPTVNGGYPALSGAYIPLTALNNSIYSNLKAYGVNNKIIIDGETNGIQISIYNTIGQLVWNAQKTANRIEISLPKGIYLVKGVGKVFVY